MLERVEFDWEGRNDVITPAPKVVDGHLAVPDTPGLGVDIVVEEIRKYPSRRNVRDDQCRRRHRLCRRHGGRGALFPNPFRATSDTAEKPVSR